jgi:hypothetical protein
MLRSNVVRNMLCVVMSCDPKGRMTIKKNQKFQNFLKFLIFLDFFEIFEIFDCFAPLRGANITTLRVDDFFDVQESLGIPEEKQVLDIFSKK